MMMKGDGPIMDTESKLALKFVLSNIKRLVMDDHGHLSYMENLDEIIKDIFGVKNFTKRLNDCYDNKETIVTINEIGMKNLMQICNNKRIYSVFAELVLMNAQIHRISHILRKLERKGKKRDKDLVKELEYISDLYKDAIKTLRKKFGISKKKSSYKKKFRSVSDLVDSRKGFSSYDEDDGSLTSMIFDEDDDDDDDYSDGDGSEFGRYVRRMTGASFKKKGKTFMKSDSSFDNEDDIDDSESDIDREDDIDEKLDMLTNNMSVLTSTVQALINSRNTGYNQRSVQNSQPQSSVGVDINTEIHNLTQAIMVMAKKQNQSIDLQTSTLEFLASMVDEEQSGDNINGGAQIIEDNEIPGEKVPSRKELIDIINNGNSGDFISKDNDTTTGEPIT